jgi:N-acetylglutamate synthase-like GNAT family acetyltransferase/protein-tyrosine-phosphatase
VAEPAVETARSADLPPILALLARCGLPGAGVERLLGDLFVARRGGIVVGVVGVEPAGDYGLLRSLAVDEDQRGEGIARALCSRAVQHAAERRLQALYLLTTTAEPFFAKAGFARVRRDEVPEAIRRTQEFASLCPQSACVMTKSLGARNVLFLCTGNSARSILAEAYLNAAGGGRFKAYSAGSHPAGKVNPLALELLSEKQVATAGLRSKNWDEFAQPGAPRLDFVFTVCDNAAGEVCPVFPGHPAKEHWSIPDPAAVQGPGEAKRAAFVAAFLDLKARIDRFLERS